MGNNNQFVCICICTYVHATTLCGHCRVRSFNYSVSLRMASGLCRLGAGLHGHLAAAKFSYGGVRLVGKKLVLRGLLQGQGSHEREWRQSLHYAWRMVVCSRGCSVKKLFFFLTFAVNKMVVGLVEAKLTLVCFSACHVCGLFVLCLCLCKNKKL